MTRAPRLYFSFRSPFSWMTVERLLQVLADAHDIIEFIPYWDPDPQTEQALAARGAGFHYTQMSKAKHLYILADTKRLAQRLGLRMAWPIDIDPWWEVPHLAWLRAQALGLGAAFYATLVEARWERGENICDPDVVRRLGDAIGADGDLLALATEDPQIRAKGVDCLAAAWHDDIFGIPYLRLGRHRFWGYDRLDDFLEQFLPARGKSEATDPLDGVPLPLRSMIGVYDADTAGGCG